MPKTIFAKCEHATRKLAKDGDKLSPPLSIETAGGKRVQTSCKKTNAYNRNSLVQLWREDNDSNTMCISEWRIQRIAIITRDCIIPRIYMHPKGISCFTNHAGYDIMTFYLASGDTMNTRPLNMRSGMFAFFRYRKGKMPEPTETNLILLDYTISMEGSRANDLDNKPNVN